MPSTDMTHRHYPFLATLAALVLSCLAINSYAEGAVRVFSCNLERVCNEAGTCETEAGEVEFRLEPMQLDGNGAGSYRLSYEDKDVIMQAYSDTGPFTWRIGSDQHTLLVNSETGMLWHSLSLAASLQSRSHYLECTLAE